MESVGQEAGRPGLARGEARPCGARDDMGALLRRLRREVAPAARAQGVRLRVRGSGGRMHEDAAWVAHMLRQLVGEAIRRATPGRTQVACGPRAGALRIAVNDSARGWTVDVELARTGRVARGSRAASAGRPLALVLEASGSHLLGLSNALHDAGWRVAGALSRSDIEDAIARIRAVPDAIVCSHDLRAFGQGGELIEELRARFGAPVPAVLTTSSAGSVDALATARRLGVPLLCKPLEPAVLVRALEAMLQDG